MSVRWLEAVDLGCGPAPELHADSHPSRANLARALEDPDDPAAWDELHAFYGDQASIWTEWSDEQRCYAAPVIDGLQRVEEGAGAVVEVGCGTGEATAVLAARYPHVIATDISLQMLERARPFPGVEYVAADVRRLPFADGAVGLLTGLNAVPHVSEFNRVLARDGQVLWCTSFGAGTPLYVVPEQLLGLFGQEWSAEAACVGQGEWVLLKRR